MNVISKPEIAAKAALMAESDRIEAFIIDVNGVPRGKWLQRDKAKALLGLGIAMPRSAFLLDIWGRDVVVVMWGRRDCLRYRCPSRNSGDLLSGRRSAVQARTGPEKAPGRAVRDVGCRLDAEKSGVKVGTLDPI